MGRLGLEPADAEDRAPAYEISGIGVEFSTPKTKFGRRTILLGKNTLQVLRDHQDRQRTIQLAAGRKWQDYGMIFSTRIGTPIHPRNLVREFKKLLSDAGLPPIRFHDLRHTAASLMLNNNIPLIVVSRHLGHSRPSITLDKYGHLIPTMHVDAIEKLDELITPVAVILEKSDVNV